MAAMENLGNAILASQWTDLHEMWVVAFHYVHDMSAMMWLPRKRPLSAH